MIDYSNPDSPNIYRLTGIGGRGVTIYRVTDAGLELVWDSADDFEREGCAAYPWAHNSIQDEEFAPVNGTLYTYLDPTDGLRDIIAAVNDPNEDGCEDGGDGNPGACPLAAKVDDRSYKDGPAPESVVVGEACGSRYMISVAEKNSIGFLYEIADIASPVLKATYHLSEASEKLNAGLAYDARTLGEVDAETIQFLSDTESPTGKAAVLFSGAWSGTTSLWELECEEAATPVAPPTGDDAEPPVDAPSSSSWMASWWAGTGLLASASLWL